MISLPVSVDDGLSTGTANTSVIVFPNPASGTFTIAGWHSEGSEKTEITITDMLGKIISKADLLNTNDPIRLNLTSQPVGMYFVHLKSGALSASQKIVIRN